MLSTLLKFKFFPSSSNPKIVFSVALAIVLFGFLFFSGGKVFAAACNVSPSWQGPTSSCDVTITYQDSGGSNLATCEYRIESNGVQTFPSSGWALAGTCSGTSAILTVTLSVGNGLNCLDEGTSKCKLRIRAFDNSGNSVIDPSPFPKTFNIDFTPPVVSADNASSSWFQSRTTTLSASDTGGSIIFRTRYSWDTNPMGSTCADFGTPFSIPTATLTVPAGSHRLYLCATDNAGNVGTWDSGANQYNVDPNFPTISAFSVSPTYPPNSVTLGQPTLTVSWTVADTGGSHLQKVTIWRALFDASTCNGTNNSACAWALDPQANPPAAPANSDSWQNTYSYSPTGDNIYEYGIHVLDNAQRESTESQNGFTTKEVRIKLTNAAPTLSSAMLSPSSPFKAGVQLTFTGNWTDPEQQNGEQSQLFICKSNGIPSGNNCSGGSTNNWCVSSLSTTSSSTCNYTTQTADQGTQTYYAFECDNVQGSLCSPVPPTPPSSTSGTFLVDATAPTISAFTVSPVVPAWVNIANPNVSVSWTVSDTGGSHLQKVVVYRAPDNNGSPGAWSAIGQPVLAPANSDGPWSSSFSDTPSDGTYWYGMHVLDNVYYETTESQAGFSVQKVQVDKTAPPKPTCSPAGGTFLNSVSVTCSNTEGGVTIRYTENNTAPTTSSTQYTGAFNITNSETLTVAAWDGAGNKSQTPDNAYGFTITHNQPPTAANLSNNQATADYCFAGSPPIVVSWVFHDVDAGDHESSYQVQIDTNPNFNSQQGGNPLINSGKVTPGSTVTDGTLQSYAPVGLSYNTTYYWRVQVWDNSSASSGWVTGSSFKTSIHAYPRPDFTWSPASPSANEQVQFTDQTNFSPSATSKSWSWDFGDGSSSNQQNPKNKYKQNGSYAVLLTASDNAGSCGKSKTVNIGIPFPQWQEISPF